MSLKQKAPRATHELDKKDKKILYELDKNARQSNSQIGKKVGLSQETVYYRVKRLEEKDIIKGYRTLIDVSKLGYLTCRFFLKFQKATPKEENEVIEYYKNHSKFWWVDAIGGFRDLGIACWVKNIYEFFKIKEGLVKRFGEYISELEIGIYHKFYIYNRKYFWNKKEILKPKIMFFAKKAEFDDRDLKILRQIAGKARMNSVDISKETGISVSNVNYRMKKMKKKGIIKGFKVLLNLEKIGYYWYKVEMQLADLSIKKKMLNYFKQQKNIIYAYETISKNDIEFELEVKSYEELRQILKNIRKKFGKSIEKHYYFLWYKQHKFLFMP